MALPRQSKKSGKEEGLPSELKELADLIVTYAKQQTLDPLKQLARWVGFGVAGAVLLGIGFLLLGIGVLRALQYELRSQLSGDWSWVPYLAIVTVWGVVIAVMVGRISHGPGSKER